MTDKTDIEKKFWKALKSDKTVMLGLTGVDDGRAQPMTAMFEDNDEKKGEHAGPIWFFTAKDVELVEEMGERHRACAHFADRGHDLFASMDGWLIRNTDRRVVEKLWNPFVAAWFKGGKDDPKLQLLRFEPDCAKVWLNDNSLLAGVKLMLGADPKEDYQDKVAELAV